MQAHLLTAARRIAAALTYRDFRLLWAGCACLIHAALPCFLQRTASTIVKKLHGSMITARHRGPAPEATAAIEAAEMRR